MTPAQKAAAAERLRVGREIAAARRAAAKAGTGEATMTETIETREEAPRMTWTTDDLKAAVAAGLSVSEARQLREEGWSVEDALAIAGTQATQRTSLAVEAQRATAQAMQKAMRPENETHPGVSALSYPEGDVARPRALPFEFYYNGYPCHKFLETEHWREVELMAETEPGDYQVMRKDHSLMTVKVEAERDATQRVTKLEVRFPVSREDKWHVPPKAVVLAQMRRQDLPLKTRFLQASSEWLAITLGADPAAA